MTAHSLTAYQASEIDDKGPFVLLIIGQPHSHCVPRRIAYRSLFLASKQRKDGRMYVYKFLDIRKKTSIFVLCSTHFMRL